MLGDTGQRAGVVRRLSWTLLTCTLIAGWAVAAASRIHAAASPQQASNPQPSASLAAAACGASAVLPDLSQPEMKAQGAVPIALDGSTSLTSDGMPKPGKRSSGRSAPVSCRRPDRRSPDSRSHDGFAAWLEAGAGPCGGQRHPNPGRTEAFHRLNRTEYQNAIRDLLHLDVNVESLLPADDASYGFDNIAGVLKMSPTLMERYLAAAQKISRLAIGTPPPVPNVDYFRVADDLRRTTISTACRSARAAARRSGTRSRRTPSTKSASGLRAT